MNGINRMYVAGHKGLVGSSLVCFKLQGFMHTYADNKENYINHISQKRHTILLKHV